MRGRDSAPISSKTKTVEIEKPGQSQAIEHHRLRHAHHRDTFASAVEQRDADFVVVVFGAVGNAVNNGRVIVDRPRPESGDVIGSARHGAGRANSRQARAMKRRKPKRCSRLDFGELPRLHIRLQYSSVAGPSNESFRERPFEVHREIADAENSPLIIEPTILGRSEMKRGETAMVNARKTRPGRDRFDRKFAAGEIRRGPGRTRTMRRHVDRTPLPPISRR